MINNISTYTAVYDKPILGSSLEIKNSYFSVYIREATGYSHNVELIKKQGFVPGEDMCILLPIIEIYPHKDILFSKLACILEPVEINDITMSDTYQIVYLSDSYVNNCKLIISIADIKVSFEISEEIERHLLNTKTITIVIYYNDLAYSRTIGFDGNKKYGLFAKIKGTINDHLDRKIKYRNDWTYATLAPSYQKDFIYDTSEYSAYGYASNPSDPGDVPRKFSYRGSCMACGFVPTEKIGLTREHCTPRWLCNASVSDVKPVVADIFCEECNGYFGESYEAIVKDKYTSLPDKDFMDWIVSDKYNTFSRWALKTAYTLTQASNKKINPTWIQELRRGDIPAGFSVYILPGIYHYDRYLYITSTFDIKHGDIFLFTFISGKICFVVTNYPEYLDTPFYRVFPDYVKPSYGSISNIDIKRIHSNMMYQITGQEYIDEQFFTRMAF